MNLYEAQIIKKYEDGKIKSLEYQVLAENEFMAYLKFGRVFHKEDYEVEIQNFKLVRKLNK